MRIHVSRDVRGCRMPEQIEKKKRQRTRWAGDPPEKRNICFACDKPECKGDCERMRRSYARTN